MKREILFRAKKWINDYACAMVIRHLMEKLNNKKE